MALKNTYSKLPAGKYIELAQESLDGYDQGRIISLAFILPLTGNEVKFRLPVNWKKFQAVLKKEGNTRHSDDDYSYRVAWACTKDWIEAQMAFVESENVTIPQVFLPYAVTKDDQTLFEKVANNPGFLLGDVK